MEENHRSSPLLTDYEEVGVVVRDVDVSPDLVDDGFGAWFKGVQAVPQPRRQQGRGLVDGSGSEAVV